MNSGEGANVKATSNKQELETEHSYTPALKTRRLTAWLGAE